MTSNRRGYAMAMLAGLAIVGASTAGVAAAQSHQAGQLADAAAGQSPSPTASISDVPISSASAGVRAVTSGSIDSPATARAPATSRIPAPSTRPDAVASKGSHTASASGSPTRAQTATSPPSTPSTAAATTQKFKNGQYSATGSYNSPGGMEKVGVTLTLTSDKVTKSDLDLLGGAGISHSYQVLFQSGYSAQVIGKDIDSISLGAIAGSSLTALGFNQALQQIESQARV